MKRGIVAGNRSILRCACACARIGSHSCAYLPRSRSPSGDAGAAARSQSRKCFNNRNRIAPDRQGQTLANRPCLELIDAAARSRTQAQPLARAAIAYPQRLPATPPCGAPWKRAGGKTRRSATLQTDPAIILLKSEKVFRRKPKGPLRPPATRFHSNIDLFQEIHQESRILSFIFVYFTLNARIVPSFKTISEFLTCIPI